MWQKEKKKRTSINRAQSREGCHLWVNLLFPSPSCGLSFFFFFSFSFATRRWHCLKKQPGGTSQQLRARRSQEVKCKRGPPLEEHASPRLSSLLPGNVFKGHCDAVEPTCQLNFISTPERLGSQAPASCPFASACRCSMTNREIE